MNTFLDGVANSDIFLKSFILTLALVFLGLVFWWFYIVITLSSGFIKNGIELIGGKFINNKPMPPFYRIIEVKGIYKGRETELGILFASIKNEFKPLPYIRVRLKETIGYNTNRVPDYARIDKNYLVYIVKFSAIWGVFDKNYPSLFTKTYLTIALEKLLGTAEDVERGRTLKEIFK